MTSTREPVALVGAGRMGRGMAIAFAYAGHEVALIDAKPRTRDAFATLKSAIEQELHATLSLLSGFGMLRAEDVETTVSRVSLFAHDDCATALVPGITDPRNVV